MAPTLLFITGVLAGLIAGFILSRIFGRRRAGEGTAEVLGLEKQLREACAEAAVSRTDLAAITSQRDELKTSHSLALSAMDQLRSEKEHLTAKMAEAAEKLRSQESQTQFLEQARTDLLTQFRSLSGQMLDGSREALLKSTKETVSEPFAKEVLQCPTNADHRGCRPACETDLRGSAAQRCAPCSPAERENLQWRPGRGGIGPTADAQR